MTIDRSQEISAILYFSFSQESKELNALLNIIGEKGAMSNIIITIIIKVRIKSLTHKLEFLK